MAIGGSGKGIQIVVGTDYNDRDLKKAQRDLDRLRTQAAKSAGPMAKLGNTIRANLGPALAMAGAAAAAFAIKLGVDGVKAAIEDQKTVELLAQSLENLGQAHRQAGIEEFIAGLESSTGVVDEQLRPALQQLLIATGDVDESQRRLMQAMDISVATGQDLNTVVRALARSLATGTAGSLSRYGIILDQNTIKTKGFEAALDEAALRVRGFAERDAKTLEGRLRILQVEFDNLTEAFGYGFLGGIGDTGDGMDDMADAMRDLRPAFELLGQAIGETVIALGDIVASVEALRDELNVPTGPSWLNEFLGYLVGLPGLLKTVGLGLGLFTDDTLSAAEAHKDYRDAAVRAVDANVDGAKTAEEYAEEQRLLAEETAKAAEEFDKFAAAISKSEAVVSFGRAVTGVEKAFKNAGTAVDPFTKKGQENYELLQDLVKETASYTESQTTLAGKTAAASQGLATLADAMANSTMDPATRALLLEPIQALIDDLEEAGVDTTGLQAQLDGLKSKDITVKVTTVVTGDRLPPGTAAEWYGTAVGGIVPKRFAMGGSAKGMDTIPAMLTPGEFVIRRQAVKQFGSDFFSQLNRGINPLAGMTPSAGGSGGGLTINGGITVQSAPGERAETSLPRALRRAAFLAGVNG